MIKNTCRCNLCPDSSDSFNSKEDFRKHHASLHLDLEEEEFLEFDWVILRPGYGHFDMNMCKTFVKLNLDVFFSALSRVMGFRSENAQRAAKKCSDHHKTWTLLQIAHEGNRQELMVPYVRQFINADEQRKYPSWVSKVHDDRGQKSKLHLFRDHDLDIPGCPTEFQDRPTCGRYR